MKKKKLYIVIEDVDGVGFNTYLAGDVSRINDESVKDYTPAEIWGTRVFMNAIDFLRENKVIPPQGEIND